MRRLTLILLLALTGIFGGFAQDPLAGMRSTVKQVRDGKEYILHTVKKGQSLYMISKAYNVDINEVIKENPSVKEGLKSDQVLWIPTGKTVEPPKKKEKKSEAEKKEKEKEKIAEPPPPPPPPADLPCGTDPSVKKSRYQVALMMPLYLNELNKINVSGTGSDSVAFKSFDFIQFYEGFRLAADSLSRAGIAVKIYVYDVDKDTVKTRKLLRDPELKKMDLIIGLLYNQPFRIVADFAEQNNILLVNPLSDRDPILKNHPHTVKVRPSQESMADRVAEYIQHMGGNRNVIISVTPGVGLKDMAEKLENECQVRSLTFKTADTYTKTVEELTADQDNLVIVFADKKAAALDFVTKLNEQRNTYRINVLGLPRWDRFEGMEYDYLVNLNTHMLAADFIDYENRDVINFVRKFQDQYKTDPDDLAFQGFDITLYFLTALDQLGTSISRCLPGFETKLLGTDFRFTRKKDDGFLNQHWEIYKYENYRLKRVSW
jgi:ABC-type branched-subunit amino acid transport system substrate-binding protein